MTSRNALLSEDDIALLRQRDAGAFEPASARSRKAFRMRLPFIGAAGVLGALIAVIVALALPPSYTARAQLVIEPQPKATDFVSEQSGAQRPEGAAAPANLVETHLAALTSQDLLMKVVDKIEGRSGKPQPPQRPGAIIDPAPLSFNEILRRARLWMAALMVPPSLADARLREVEKGVKATQEGRSDVISLNFTAASPETAAEYANRIVETFVATRVEDKRKALKLQLQRLVEQIEALRRQAERADLATRSMLGRLALESQRFGDQRMRESIAEAAGARQLLPPLERRVTFLRNAIASVEPDARVLSLATPPERPNAINPLLLAGPAFLIFAFAGNWLAGYMQRRDKSLRSDQDVTDLLGIPCLGLAPLLPRRVVNGQYRQYFTMPNSPWTQAIKAIASSLRGPSARGGQAVMITSSVPGEGKTTLAASLGVFAALLGKRVLIVDFSASRGRIQRKLLGASQTQEPQDKSPIDSIERAYDLGLDYMFLGRRAVDFPDPFGGDDFAALLTQLRERYDLIFLDAPPMLGDADAPLLARYADNVLFAVKWQSARHAEIRNAMELLRRAGRSDAAAVLTQVDLKEHARYSFGDFSEYLLKRGRSDRLAGFSASDIFAALRRMTGRDAPVEKPPIDAATTTQREEARDDAEKPARRELARVGETTTEQAAGEAA